MFAQRAGRLYSVRRMLNRPAGPLPTRACYTQAMSAAADTTHPTPPSAQYWQDRRWIRDHYSQLMREHPNEWVAVHCGIVLSAGEDLGEVEDAARAGSADQDIVYQFIEDGSLIF